MKFDEAINYIAENLAPIPAVTDEMAKPKNPFIVKRAAELEKQGLSPATAYAYARKEFLAQKASGDAPAPVSAPSSSTPLDAAVPASAPTKYKDAPDTIATKLKVAEIYGVDNNVSDEEVLARIESDIANGDKLNADPEVIKGELEKLRSGSVDSVPSDIGSDEEKRLARHAAIRASMARLGMKMGDPEKVLGGKKKIVSKRRGSDEPGPAEPSEFGGADDLPSRRGPKSIDPED